MMRLFVCKNVLFVIVFVASSLSASVLQQSGDSCSEDQWKCDDGSCIDRKWNGNVKCQNSSVPSHSLRRRTRQTEKDNVCVLPAYPAHGTYTTHIHNAKPGDSYELVTTKVTCDHGFALNGSASAYCVKGEWSEPMPKCVSQCHLPPHDSVEYRCLLETEGSRPCNTYEVNGTVVSPQCRRPNYYSASVLSYMRCVDGHWNYIAATHCIPECGTVPSTGTELIIGGLRAMSAEVPWHAAIYTKTTNPYMQICGGSLISNSVVLSAAHCFWSNFESKQLPAAEFAVAVGKLYRPWNDDKEDAQRSDVKAVHLPPNFQGSVANFQEDIAVVVVTTPYVYTTLIRPVCVNFDNLFLERQLKVGNMGKVAGWGLTDVNGKASQVLQVINLPYVSTGTCIEDSPPDFRGYITGDKICAGFKNEQKAVCKGDSGGGLAFPESERGTPHYYLRGVASTAPSNEDKCNANFYTAFTLIQKHEHFLKKYFESEEKTQYSDHASAPEAQPPSPAGQPQSAAPTPPVQTQSPKPTPSPSHELPCKEVLLRHRQATPIYSVDSDTLNHVTVHRNSAGRLTDLQMHVAVQADRGVRIRLTNKNGIISNSDIRFEIAVGWDLNQYTQLDLWDELRGIRRNNVENIHTPNILSSTGFTEFYIKIVNGELQFGKRGASPLMSHYDGRLSEINYFRIFYGGDNTAKARFDCPA